MAWTASAVRRFGCLAWSLIPSPPLLDAGGEFDAHRGRCPSAAFRSRFLAALTARFSACLVCRRIALTLRSSPAILPPCLMSVLHTKGQIRGCLLGWCFWGGFAGLFHFTNSSRSTSR